MPDDADMIPTRYAPPSAMLRGVLAILAGIGVAISVMLLWTSGGGRSAPGCGPGSACDEVLSSRWSHVAGLPVSALSAGVYVAVLAGVVHIRPGERRRRQRVAWTVLVAAGVLLLAAAAWFVMVQLAILGAVCAWCMGAHACGFITGAVLLFHAPLGRARLYPGDSPDPMMLSLPAAATAIVLPLFLTAGMSGVQAMQSDARVEVRTFGGVVGRPGDMPILGDPEAAHVMVYLYDYTCPHCRLMHGQLQQVAARYAGQVVIALMPVPLDAACNGAVAETEPRHAGACELAKLALMTWRTSPDAFVQMNEWLFGPEEPRQASDARKMAADLVGDAALSNASTVAWAEARIASHVELYRGTGEGVLPRLIADKLVIAGRPGEVSELFAILERELGLRPVDSLPSPP